MDLSPSPVWFLLVLRDTQSGDEDFGVVREPNPVNAVGGFQLSRRYQRGLIVTRYYAAVDRTFHLAGAVLDARKAVRYG